MYELLAWLEGSALGVLIRGAGVWTYGLLNLVHILGISTLFGAVLILDLRLFGLWRRIPLTFVAQTTVPLAVIGFLVAAISGACMVTVNATDYHGNPFFYTKFPAILLALSNLIVLWRLPAWKHIGVEELKAAEHRQLVFAAALSLSAWLIALAAGRMIGYW